MARNLVNWTDRSVAALGVHTHTGPDVWWREPGGSGIYLAAAVTGRPETDDRLRAALHPVLEAWSGQTMHLWDCHAVHDLAGLGLTREWQSVWYLRRPAPLSRRKLPAGLNIERVTTLAQLGEFERATILGFDAPPDVLRGHVPFSRHAAATLHTPGMTYLNGRLDGQVVAGAIVHAAHGIAGIYGVSTLPGFRRRGYASALVHACVALHPELPACVQPDPDTIPIYTRLAFIPGGEIAAWCRD